MKHVSYNQLKQVLHHAQHLDEESIAVWTPQFTIVWDGKQLYKRIIKTSYREVEITISELQKMIEEF